MEAELRRAGRSHGGKRKVPVTTLHPIEAPPATMAMPAVPRILRQFWIASFVAFWLMFVAGFVRWRMGAPATHYNPLGGRMFGDLLEYVPTFRLVHTAAFFRNPVTPPVAYPPFSAMFYAALYATGKPVVTYLLLAAVWLAALTWGVGGWLARAGVRGPAAWLLPLTVVMMAFPFEAMVRYGNVELFLWVFAALGVWAFQRGRPEVAAVLWGCAGAMKLYPVVLLVLLWPRRQWRAVACGVAAFCGVTLASLWFLGPTLRVAFAGSVHNVFGYQGVRVAEWTLHELATNHSAFTWVKLVLRVCGRPFEGGTLPYFACGAAVFAVAYFGRVSRLPITNQVLFVTVFMLLLPPISYFHTLVHLFAPLLLLVGVALEAERRGEWVAGLNGTIALFVPLFGSFMLLTERRVFLFGGLVQGALVLALFYRAARYPFSLEFGEVTAFAGEVQGDPPPSMVALNS